MSIRKAAVPFGLAFGMGLGFAFDDLSMGIVLGVVFGTAFSTLLINDKDDEGAPAEKNSSEHTPEE